MATSKNIWTPELARRLHQGVSLLFAAAVIVAVGFCLLLVVLSGELRYLDGGFLLIVLIPGLFIALIVAGLAKVRGVTKELSASLGGVPSRKIAAYGGQETPEYIPEAPPISAPASSPARSAIEPPAAAYARQGAKPSKKTAAPAQSSGPAIEWEEWVGQKLLQKVGIVIVLIGMLVLLQQAFENRWINELGRVFLALLGSAVMLGAGEFFQKKYPQWSHGFTGGGLALAYLAVWVAHVLYADVLARNYGLVIPAGVAFALYGAITAVGVLLAVRYKAQTVAWFAIAGGYLTPLLVVAPVPNPYTFSAYLGILAAGLLALFAYRSWQGIALAAFVLTQYYLAAAVYPSVLLPDHAQVVIAVAFFALFAAVPLIRQFRLKVRSTPEDLLLIVGNAVAVFLPVQDALGGWQSEWVTLLCIALAAYTVACSVLALRTRGDDAVLGDTYLLGSIALIALALFHQLEWEWLALGWAPFAAVTAYLAVSLKRRSVWVAANLLLAGAVASLVTQLPVFTETEGSWRPFLSNWSLQSYVLFASLLAMIPASRSAPQEFTKGVNVEAILHAMIALLAFGVLTFEVTALHWTATTPLALAYLAYAGLATVVFLVTRQIVWFAAAFLAQAVVFLFTFVTAEASGMHVLRLLRGVPAAAELPLVHPWGFVSILSIALVVGLLAVAMRGSEHPMLPRIQTRHLLLGMVVAQVWLHVSVEIQHVAAALEFSNLEYQRALSAWWIIAGVIVSFVAWTPEWRKVAVVLLALPFAKDLLRIMGGDATLFDTVAWTIIALGVAIMGQHLKKQELVMAGVTALCGTALADMLFNLGQIDAGILRSVWWAIAGLMTMVSGFALRSKLLRQASIGIFAATVVKLLLFDFAVLDTPVRIVASIATGLLLIGASYLYQRYGTPSNEGGAR